jgi:hypothetical protein
MTRGTIRYGAAFAVVAVVILAIAWVALSLRENTDPDTRVLHPGDVFVLMETEEYTGMVAGVGIAGRLGLVGGHCVGFAGGGSRGVLIVFPPGTTVHGTGDDLVIDTGEVELRLGDRFDGGSRRSDPAPLSEYGDLDQQVPKQCRGMEAMDVSDFMS